MITKQLNINDNLQEIPANSGKAFPVTLHYNDLGNWVEPVVGWHWHEALEFDIVLKGKLRIYTNHSKFTFSEGEGCFINADAMHHMTGASDTPPVLLTHLLDSSFLSGAYQSVFEQKYINPVLNCRELEILPFTLSNSNHRKILEHLYAAYNAGDEEENGYEFIMRNELSSAWLRLLKEAEPYLKAPGVQENLVEPRVKKMMLFIQKNYMEKLSLDQIAQAANVSRRECLRDFQKYLHMTPFSYLIEYRLHEAAGNLTDTEKSITQIAEDNGFSTASYFARLFKEKYEITPLEYRKNSRENLTRKQPWNRMKDSVKKIET